MKKLLSLVPALVLAAALICLTGCYLSISSSNDAPAAESSTTVNVAGDKIETNGRGVAVSGREITVSASGTYYFSGKLENGKIIVNTGDDPMKVVLVLNGFDISCADGAAIEIKSADSVKLYIGSGTVNTVTSGTDADMARCTAESSGAAIHSSCDLDLRCDGSGELKVFGYINNGIACKKDLDVEGGEITVVAANNGVKGNRSVEVKGGSLTVTAQGDGIKTTDASKEGKGYVEISGGTVSVNAGQDGIASESWLTISGGTVSVNCENTYGVSSAKALKAKTGLTVSGGSVTLSAYDHAVHSTAGIIVSGGSLTACSESGKGMAAHEDIAITGGSVYVSASGDGIETKGSIEISGGTVGVESGDDGITCGDDSSGFGVTGGTVTISGGNVYVSAASDPVNGKTAFEVSGGTVLGVGGGKTMKEFSESSSQARVCGKITGTAGEEIEIGNDKVTAAADYKYFIYSSADIRSGSSVTVTYGGKTQTFTAA